MRTVLGCILMLAESSLKNFPEPEYRYMYLSALWTFAIKILIINFKNTRAFILLEELDGSICYVLIIDNFEHK